MITCLSDNPYTYYHLINIYFHNLFFSIYFHRYLPVTTSISSNSIHRWTEDKTYNARAPTTGHKKHGNSPSWTTRCHPFYLWGAKPPVYLCTGEHGFRCTDWQTRWSWGDAWHLVQAGDCQRGLISFVFEIVHVFSSARNEVVIDKVSNWVGKIWLCNENMCVYCI